MSEDTQHYARLSPTLSILSKLNYHLKKFVESKHNFLVLDDEFRVQI